MSRLPGPSAASRAEFHTTQWELVRQAGESEGEAGREPLEAFCRSYWYPLYAFLRRRGESAADSADLVQGFFADFLGREDLKKVSREGGRLRSYLLVSLRNYASNERARQGAQRRGGGLKILSVDGEEAEERYRIEPVDARDAESAYERSWAVTILERALERLESEHGEGARRESFERLSPFLGGNPPEGGLAEVAESCASSTGALKVALHRLRKRYRELLRLEVRETLGPGEDVDRELEVLLAALDEESE